MSRKEWDKYLKYYNEQKRLEEYQQKRKLSRPKTTKLSIAIYTILLLIILIGGIRLFLLSVFSPWGNILIFIGYIICIIELYGRFFAIKIVECYQHYASEEKRRRCKCIPSCSEYAILCLKKCEFVFALFKIRKRLFVTCKGFDYIIDNP